MVPKLAVATLVAAVLACAALGARETSAVSAQTPPATCPSNLSIAVTAPIAGGVTTPVTVVITPTLNLKAAAAQDPTSFHLHYYVDIDPTKTLNQGIPIPTGDPKIIHSASLAQDIGPLGPGPHTVWVVVGQASHQACGTGSDGSIVTASTTFNVPALSPAPPVGGQPVPPSTGSGGVQARNTNPLMVATVIGVAAVLVATGRRISRPRNG